MRRPLGSHGFAFNLPLEDAYEQQPPVVAFDLRDEVVPVQSALAFVTFIALSTTPQGAAAVEGTPARGRVRFRLIDDGLEAGSYEDPFQNGWEIEGPAGQRYTITQHDMVLISNVYYAVCEVIATAPGAEGNLANGAEVTLVDGDVTGSFGGPAAETTGQAYGVFWGGTTGSEGVAPVGSTLVVRDVREDTMAIAGAAAAAYTPLWTRVPVRGPVQVELGLATTATGYVEDDSPDVVRQVVPLRRLGGLALGPAVHVQHVDGFVHVGDVPAGVHEVSLYVHAPSGGSRVDLGYVPVERADLGDIANAGELAEHTVALVDVPGGVAGFITVLERIPVRGPGAIYASVVVGGQDVTLYGLITR